MVENEKRGFSNWSTPRELCYLAEKDNGLAVPRGCTREMIRILNTSGTPFRLNDQRRTLPDVDFQFSGKLRHYQQQALDAIFSRDFGTLAAPTGSGKTVIALAAIAARQQPALIVVHTMELMNQWIDRIQAFLNIPAAEVGRIGNGNQVMGERITVALVQSLYKCAQDVAPRVGFLLLDECHRAPSRTFTEAVTAFDSRFMLGLSATPWRRDGLSRLIYWYLGDQVHAVKRQGLIESGDILQVEVVWRETAFTPTCDPSIFYQKMMSELVSDEARNNLICGDVVKESHNGGGVCLVLSDRKSHCQALADLLALRGVKAEVLTGELPANQRQRIVERLNDGKIRVIVATGGLLGEGFDCRRLSRYFLQRPSSLMVGSCNTLDGY